MKTLFFLLLAGSLLSTFASDDFSDIIQEKGNGTAVNFRVAGDQVGTFKDNSFVFYTQITKMKEKTQWYYVFLKFQKTVYVRKVSFKMHSGELASCRFFWNKRTSSYVMMLDERKYRRRFIDDYPVEIHLETVSAEDSRKIGKNVKRNQVILSVNQEQINAIKRLGEYHLAQSDDGYVPGTNKKTADVEAQKKAVRVAEAKKRREEERKQREAEMARREEKERKERELRAAKQASYSTSSQSSYGGSNRICAECEGKKVVIRNVYGEWQTVTCPVCGGSGNAPYHGEYLDASGVRHRSQADQDLARDISGTSGGTAGTFYLGR